MRGKLLACGGLVHFRRVALTHFLRARKRAFQDPLKQSILDKPSTFIMNENTYYVVRL